MSNLFFFLIIIAALATLVVLVRGVLLMASGKDITGERQNRLMTMRVGLQGLAILFVIIFLMLAGSGR